MISEHVNIAKKWLHKTEKKDYKELRAWFKAQLGNVGDIDPRETPWCAAFVNSCIIEAGYKGTGTLWARDFLTYGEKIKSPEEGDIVIFNRGKGYGHVAFYMEPSNKGYIKVLGGNQDNMVCIKDYPLSKVLGYRRVPGTVL